MHRNRLPFAAAFSVGLLAACESVSVTTVAVSFVELAPTEVSLIEGSSVQLIATLRDDAGNSLTGRQIAWSTGNPDIATVDGNGVVRGMVEGATSVRASAEGISANTSVTVLRGPTVGLSSASVQFLGSENGPRPEPIVVAVFNDGAGSLDQLGTSVDFGSGPEGWLVASLGSSQAPTTLTLTAQAQGLEPGNYAALVHVTAAASAVKLLSVTFTVDESAAVIGLSTDEVAFHYVAGDGPPEPALVTVDNLGSQALSGLGAGVTYGTEGAGWLSASLSPTTAPSTLTLSVSPEGLQAGDYAARVDVMSSDAVNSPQSVVVALTVERPPPRIVLGASELRFSVPQGSSVSPPQLVTIANGGGSELAGLEASVSYQGGPTGWITMVLAATQAPTHLAVAVDPAGLAPGSYAASVSIRATDAVNSPQTVSVLLTVSAAPALIALNPSFIELGGQVGSGATPSASVAVTNGGPGSLSQLVSAVSYDAGQPEGWLDAALVDASAPTTLQITASVGELAAGTYGATVFVSSAIAGNSPQGVDVTFTVGSPPTAPSNLTATAVSPTQVDLSWTDSSDDEDQFRLERQDETGPWVQLAILTTGSVTYSDLSVTGGSTYSYRIRACREGICSTPSAEVSVTTPVEPAPPAAPSGLVATPAAHDRVALAWTDNSDNEDTFELERSSDGGASWPTVATTTPNQTTYSDETVTAETQYLYRVRACNAEGCSTYSEIAAAETPAALTPPAPVSDLTATAVSTSRIDLTWTDNSDNEDRFEIRWRRGTGNWRWSAAVGPDVTQYSATGLRRDRLHQFEVRACNDGGCSTWVRTEARTLDD